MPASLDLEGLSDEVRGTQPRALIVTIYGLYARELGGWLSVSSLIKLMAEFGVDETAVRSSISRLKRRGLLDAAKIGGVAGYSLSDDARSILREGDWRIFERRRAKPADGWMLAVFSIPESERQKRHQLRSRLSWLGFGTVAAGVWIAPAHVESEVKDMLESTELSAYVDLFHAQHVAFRPERDQVAAWWDLEALEATYEEYIAVYGQVLAKWRRRKRVDDAAAFADYVDSLTHWRRVRRPGLAVEFLPPAWRGAHAADIFFELHERLAPLAHRHVQTVTRAQVVSQQDASQAG